jgi:hypothetical protein
MKRNNAYKNEDSKQARLDAFQATCLEKTKSEHQFADSEIVSVRVLHPACHIYLDVDIITVCHKNGKWVINKMNTEEVIKRIDLASQKKSFPVFI